MEKQQQPTDIEKRVLNKWREDPQCNPGGKLYHWKGQEVTEETHRADVNLVVARLTEQTALEPTKKRLDEIATKEILLESLLLDSANTKDHEGLLHLLQRYHDDMRQVCDDAMNGNENATAEFQAYDTSFHLAGCKVLGHKNAEELLRSAINYPKSLSDQLPLSQHIQQHELIIEAVGAQDMDAAFEAIRNHVNSSLENWKKSVDV